MNVQWFRLVVMTLVVLSSFRPAFAVGPTPNDAIDQDAFEYAQQYSVTMEQARQRLQWQILVGGFEERLAGRYPDSFAGLWIDHAPTFQIVVLMTQPEQARSTMDRMLANGPLSDRVVTRQARHSLKELQDHKTLARDAVIGFGELADFDIDVRTNQVVLYTRSQSQFNRSLSKSRQALPETVRVEEVEELAKPAADIYGGLSGGACTLGFSVVDSNGTRGISSAAHCPNNLYYTKSFLPFQGECYYGSHDVQWHTDGFHTAQPRVKVGSGTRDIYWVTGRNSQAIGAYVCKQGITTGYNCGSIISKNINPSYIPSGNATFILVDGGSTSLVLPGDSGGPWFSGNSAFGITSGFQGKRGIYTAINYLSCLNVSVLKAPLPPLDPACAADCEADSEDCLVDFCYWDYDEYMCSTGCRLELDECMMGCYD